LAHTAAVAASIGVGATLQAIVGVTLIRQLVDSPTILNRERDIVRFFVVAGPVTHIVNATWATLTLFAAGAISQTAITHTWWTWWVGDSIGALIFAPLVIMWLSNESSWLTRRVAVSAPLIVMFVATIALFAYTRHSDWQSIQQRFAQDTGDISDALTRRMDIEIEALNGISDAFGRNSDSDSTAQSTVAALSSPRFTRDRFARITAPIMARHPEIKTIAWAPRVAGNDRPVFENITGARIVEPTDNSYSGALNRDVYFPIRYAALSSGDHNIIGLDVAASASLHRAIAAALEHNCLAATTPAETRSLDNPSASLSFVLPVYIGSAINQSPLDNSNAQPLGVALLAISIPQLLETVLQDFEIRDSITLSIEDVTTTGSPILIHTAAHTRDDDGQLPANTRLPVHSDIELAVADRNWRLHFAPTLEYLTARQTPSAWLVLAVGLFFTALISGGALFVTGRAQAIESLVNLRTNEIAQINEKLADEICEHLSTEHTLEKERELLKAVIQNLHEGILVLDISGELQMANGMAYRMLRDITGHEIESLQMPHPFRMYAPDGVTELLQEQTPQYAALRGRTVSDFEMVAQAPGRAPMTLIVNAQPLLTSDNQRHGAIIVMRDITDRKVIERMKSEFVATVSHELRTPITSIRGSLGLLAGGVAGAMPDKARNLVDIALRNSDRLAHLINDLLDMEKMESGKMQFELQPHSLSELVAQAIEANTGYAQNLNVRLALIEPVPNVWVTVDSFRLLQVMGNLLSNAAKFSPTGSTVEVSVSTRVDNKGAAVARVAVIDKGPGIPDEFRSRIFQKFSQADGSDARTKGGTGLGLAICKTIMEQMGGEIGYETKLGAGSTFYFDLPRAGNPTNTKMSNGSDRTAAYT
jgi:PAS domain S-box-containing protein